MKKALVAASLVISAAVLAMGFTQGFKSIREFLTGYEEVPSVSTVASAEFRARISADDTALDYELSYADLEGAVQQAHIHFGQRGVNGGISVWLCGNASAGPPPINPPAGTPACPPSPATVTGTLTAANVVGPAGQGIAAGEFAELVAAIRAGKTYANVHSTKFPGGEVRSQIEPGGGNGHSRHK
jgi:hypothetical protein